MGQNKLKSKEIDVPLEIGKIYRLKNKILIFTDKQSGWRVYESGDSLLLLEFSSLMSEKDPQKLVINLKFLTPDGKIGKRADFLKNLETYLDLYDTTGENTSSGEDLLPDDAFKIFDRK